MSDKFINLGGDEPYDLPDNENWKYVVYYYNDYGYDGDGELVVVRNDNKISLPRDLTHCSCYSPCEKCSWNEDEFHELSYYENIDNVHDVKPCDVIITKLRELLS